MNAIDGSAFWRCDSKAVVALQVAATLRHLTHRAAGQGEDTRRSTIASKLPRAHAPPVSITRRNAGTQVRDSRQARCPAKAIAAGIDAASMGRRCLASHNKIDASSANVESRRAMRGTARRGLFAAKQRRRKPQADGGHERRRVPR